MNRKIYFNNQNLHITNAIEEDSSLKILGTAAHFGSANLNGEIVDEKSFDSFFTLYNAGKLTPALNYNHDSAMLIGGVDKLYVTDNALCCEAHLNKDVAFCRDTLIPMVKGGDIKSFSTEGFVDYNDIVTNEDNTYYCKNFLLTAIAVVSVPADYNSEFSIKNYVEACKLQQPKKLNPYYFILR